MTKDYDVDHVFNEVVKEFNDKVTDLNALISEAKDLCSHYEIIRKDIVNLYTNPNFTELDQIQLKEHFYKVIKNLNSLNKELFDIIMENETDPKYRTQE